MKILMQSLQRQQTPTTPVWVMRQAGRYLPEYRKIRAQAGGFLQMCKNPEIAAEITMQPIQRFGFDAAIIFSDILTIPDAMGLGLRFVEGTGPQFAKSVCDAIDVDNLPTLQVDRDLGYVRDAVSLVTNELDEHTALIGFCGSPWTTAVYMIEGSSPNGGFIRSKQMLYNSPQVLEALLAKLVDVMVDYLAMQIRAGADCVQIFDTWGGVLSADSYLRFSLRPMVEIINRLRVDHPQAKVILFTKNSGHWLGAIAETQCDAIGIDWTVHLGQARHSVGASKAVQGNLDPAILRSSAEVIQRHTYAMMNAWGNQPGHIANLGHGITPDIPVENVQIFIDSVRRASEAIRSK